MSDPPGWTVVHVYIASLHIPCGKSAQGRLVAWRIPLKPKECIQQNWPLVFSSSCSLAITGMFVVLIMCDGGKRIIEALGMVESEHSKSQLHNMGCESNYAVLSKALQA